MQQPTILSKPELRQLVTQIKDKHIGIYGQEQLKCSEVVINGLGGIGVTVMRCLIASGVGNLHIIDNKIVAEDMLPTQSLFDINDVGKLRCIAAREKQIINSLGTRLTLHNTSINNSNADRLIGNSKIIIETRQDYETNQGLFDLADQKKVNIIGGLGSGWRGVFGIYRLGDSKEKLTEALRNLYLRNPDYNKEQSYFSFVANHIGGAIAAMTIRALLDIEQRTSLYEIDMLNFSSNKIL